VRLAATAYEPPGPHPTSSSRTPTSQDGGFGLLRGEGTALVVTVYLGEDLRGLLATPGLVWASAVEPRLAVSRTPADEGFHALAFAPDGTDVLEGMLRHGLSAGTTVDFAQASPARSGSPAPSPREDFVAVFSFRNSPEALAVTPSAARGASAARRSPIRARALPRASDPLRTRPRRPARCASARGRTTCQRRPARARAPG